jgi:hypothetical protein
MTALESVISLALLLGLISLYNQYRVDRFRNDVFAVRDRLFDRAMAGEVSFDGQGYRTARAVCNGLVRFAHQISMLHWAVRHVVLTDAHLEVAKVDFDRRSSAMSAKEREVFNSVLAETHVLVIKHLVTSPLMIVTVIVPLTTLLAGKKCLDGLIWLFRGALKELDLVAAQEGRLGAGQSPQHVAVTVR